MAQYSGDRSIRIMQRVAINPLTEKSYLTITSRMHNFIVEPAMQTHE